ncbi:hypothetical protein Tco_1346590 [Tanacetum coccineum]
MRNQDQGPTSGIRANRGTLNASDTGVAPKQQQQVIPQTTAISNIKLPILKKEEYDIWRWRWSITLITAAEIQAVEKERKAKNILLMAIPKEHMRRFHGMDDAKEIWEAIRTRFGGNANSKKMRRKGCVLQNNSFEALTISVQEGLEKGYDRFQQLLSQLEAHGAEVSIKDANYKFLRSLPPTWSNLAMTMRTKPDVDTLSIDDLYNNPRVSIHTNPVGFEHLEGRDLLENSSDILLILESEILMKLKGKNIADTAVSKPSATIAPGMFKLDIEPISHILKNNKDAHEVYLEKTIENTNTLCGLAECARKQNPSKPLLESACMFTKHVQEFNIPKQTDSLKTKDSNKPLLTSTGIKRTTSASRSKPSENTKTNRILRPPSSNQKNKVEEHPRKVKSSLNKMNSVSEPISNAHVKHSVRNAKFESICAICNKCLFDANHDMCVIDYVNDVNVRSKSKSKRNKMRKVWKPTGKVFNEIGYSWKPTGRTFTIVGNKCPLTRITSTKEVPLKETTITPVITQSPTLKVYSRKPKASRSVGSSSKAKIVESKTSNTKEPKQSWGSTVSDVPSSSLIDCRLSKLFCGTVRFGNDHIAKIMGYGDYQMGNVTISRVYYVERLSHLNFDYITALAKQGLLRGLPKLKYQKDHLCSACALDISSEQFSSGPGPKLLTPGTIISGLVQSISSSTPFIPPTKNDWEILFQPMFDEYLNPPSCVDHQVLVVIAPEPVVQPVHLPQRQLIKMHHLQVPLKQFKKHHLQFISSS